VRSMRPIINRKNFRYEMPGGNTESILINLKCPNKKVEKREGWGQSALGKARQESRGGRSFVFGLARNQKKTAFGAKKLVVVEAKKRKEGGKEAKRNVTIKTEAGKK